MLSHAGAHVTAWSGVAFCRHRETRTLRVLALLTAALVLTGAGGAASKKAPAPPPPPAETVEQLRQPVMELCKQRMPPDLVPTVGVDGACTCMIDGIVAEFGSDALSMLRVIAAGLDPSQIKEIGVLLKLKEADAEKFVEMAQPKIEQIQASCAK